MLRVLHLTDPHLFAATDGSLRGTVTYKSLQAVLEHYADSDWQADLVLVTGDLIQDDSEGAYRHFADLLRLLELPVYCVPGNHDVRELMQAVLDEPPFHYCPAATLDDWLIIGLDSCVSGQAGGALSSSELARFDAEVAASSSSHVMVCLHHPPVPMGSKWLDSVGLANGDEALQKFSAPGKVRLTVSGHVHQDYAAMHEGMLVVATPSTCSQFAAGSDEFAIADQPPAYRRIELQAGGTFGQQLVWVPDAG